ncbi:MAG: Fe-S-containing protein [Saccharofermentanales bacterium]
MTEKIIPDKKEKIYENKKSNMPLFAGLIIFAALIISAGIFVSAYLQKKSPLQDTLGDPVAAPRSYIGLVEHMETVQIDVSDGKVRFDLADIDKMNMAGFEIENDEGFLVPMMAYITSSGRLFVGSSLCECGGRKFSLAGKTLFCDKCRTTYDIENQKYISGAAICGKYPPVNMKASVENGTISLEYSSILNWRPRKK